VTEPGEATIKDLIDQIRTVHLTLVLVAFVLLAAALQEPRRKVERSVSDARTIYLLAQELQPAAGPVGDEVDRAVAQYVARSGQQLQTEQLNLEITWASGEKQTVGLFGGAFGAAAYLSDGRYESEDDIQSPAYSYVPFQVRSLGEFIRFWDHNLTEQMVNVPKVNPNDIETIFREEGLGRVAAKSFRFLPPNAKPSKLMELHGGVEGDSLKFFTYPATGEPGVTIAVPVTKIPSINIQALLIRYAKKEQDWLPGKFATSFPELSDRAKNLTTLDLRDLVTELNDEANRDQDKIELLGAKLDPIILTRWGLFIVAICQFYLWVHLNALRQSVVATPGDFPTLGWVGIYPGVWAQIFTIASVLIPPVIAVYWLVIQWAGFGFQWQLVACLNALVCLVLGLATVRTLHLVHARIVDTSSRPSASN
jgi:hypothetical protein